MGLETIDRLFHPDYAIIQPDGRIETKDDVLASYRSGTRQWESAEADEMNVRLYGNMARVIGRRRARGQNGPEYFDYTARFLSIWIKADGRWQNIAYQSAIIEEAG